MERQVYSVLSCVGQVARSSNLWGEKQRCPVTGWASKVSRTSRLADRTSWTVSIVTHAHTHTQNEKKQLTFYEILVSIHGVSIRWIVILSTERGTSKWLFMGNSSVPKLRYSRQQVQLGTGSIGFNFTSHVTGWPLAPLPDFMWLSSCMTFSETVGSLR